MLNSAPRALEGIELNMAHLHKKGGTTQTSSSVLLDNVLEKNHVKSVIFRLFEIHQALRCTIDFVGPGYYICEKAKSENIPCEFSSTKNIVVEDEIARQVNRILPETNHLWRISVLQDKSRSLVTLTCHHSIVDAVSLALILENFCILYNSIIAGDACLDIPKKRRVLRNNIYRKESVDNESIHFFENHISVPFESEGVNIDKRMTKVKCYVLNSIQLERVKRIANDRELTLNSMFVAAIFKALDLHGYGPKISINTAVSLRDRFFPCNEDDPLGCAIGVVPANFDVNDYEYFSFARNYQRTLRRGIEMVAKANESTSIDGIEEKVNVMCNSDSFDQGFGVTNHGVINLLGSYDELKVLKYINIANRNIGNFALAIHITTFGHETTFSLTYVFPLIEPKIIDSIGESIISTLINMKIEGVQ